MPHRYWHYRFLFHTASWWILSKYRLDTASKMQSLVTPPRRQAYNVASLYTHIPLCTAASLYQPLNTCFPLHASWTLWMEMYAHVTIAFFTFLWAILLLLSLSFYLHITNSMFSRSFLADDKPRRRRRAASSLFDKEFYLRVIAFIEIFDDSDYVDHADASL